MTMKIAVRPGARNVGPMLGVLNEEVRRRLGSQMEIEIEQTEEFERSADGKTPAFKRLFRAEPGVLNAARCSRTVNQYEP